MEVPAVWHSLIKIISQSVYLWLITEWSLVGGWPPGSGTLGYGYEMQSM